MRSTHLVPNPHHTFTAKCACQPTLFRSFQFREPESVEDLVYFHDLLPDTDDAGLFVLDGGGIFLLDPSAVQETP